MRPAATELLWSAQHRLERRELAAATANFDQAEVAGADADACAGGRWLAHMLAGDYAAAWSESDAIRRRGAHDPHRFWLGEDLSDRQVILRCLHGYGDTVQFLRYVPHLRRLARQLIIEVPSAMREIVACIDGVNAVTTWEMEAQASSDWDSQVEVTELPYLFRTQLAELPITEGYLHLPASSVNAFGQFVGRGYLARIGVIWSAAEWNPGRSVPVKQLQRLMERRECEFWNLQGGTAWREWDQLRQRDNLRDVPACRNGILPLASAIAALDLLITVDTLAAHLAGAMGKPAWVLLQRAGDWRWMTERIDSPWYPSLRLFRQCVQGEWDSVVRDVSEHLEQWLRDRTGHRVTT